MSVLNGDIGVEVGDVLYEVDCFLIGSVFFENGCCIFLDYLGVLSSGRVYFDYFFFCYCIKFKLGYVFAILKAVCRGDITVCGQWNFLFRVNDI